METKTDLAGALYRVVGAALKLIEETLNTGDLEPIKVSDAKTKVVLTASRIIGLAVTAFCRLGLIGDEDVNDSSALQQYRAEIERQITALKAQIERKRREKAGDKAGRTHGAAGRRRSGGHDGVSDGLEEAGAPSPAGAQG